MSPPAQEQEKQEQEQEGEHPLVQLLRDAIRARAKSEPDDDDLNSSSSSPTSSSTSQEEEEAKAFSGHYARPSVRQPVLARRDMDGGMAPEARLWNAAAELRLRHGNSGGGGEGGGSEALPLAIVRPRSAAEIARIMRCVWDFNHRDPDADGADAGADAGGRNSSLEKSRRVEVCVRGGGHSVMGYSMQKDAVVVDLSAGMNSAKVVEVVEDTDADSDQAAYALVDVQGGCLWGTVDDALGARGFAGTGGLISHTGAVGLALGGGLGWLSRRMGLTCDTVVQAEVVSADGRILVADADSETDLFWALQGGGGNFGVVSRLRLRGERVPTVRVWFFQFFDSSAARRKEVLQGYREACAAAEVTTSAFAFITSPVIFIVVVDSSAGEGPEDEPDSRADSNRCAEVLHALRPDTAQDREMVMAELNRFFDAGNKHGDYYVWSRSSFLQSLSDDVLDASIEYAAGLTRGSIEIMHLGGRIAERAPSESPFVHREAGFEIHAIIAVEPSEVPSQSEQRDWVSVTRKWTRAFHERLAPHSIGEYYNTDGRAGDTREGSEKMSPGLYGDNEERLRRVKRALDPENVFCFNHNISPE